MTTPKDSDAKAIPPAQPSGDQLYQQLCKLLRDDPDVEELGLVVHASPALFGQGKDDEDAEDDGPPFILREHRLGIAFWCIPSLFSHAVSAFNRTRKQVCSFVPR